MCVLDEYVDSQVCVQILTEFLLAFLDLSPSESYIDAAPTLHLRAYSVNQKGRSEATVLEDIAINEPEKRTGTYVVVVCDVFGLYGINNLEMR